MHLIPVHQCSRNIDPLPLIFTMPLLALTRHPGGLRSATRNCGQPMSGPRLLHTGALPSPQLHPEPPGTASACALAGLHSDLEKLAPRFNINSKQIKILRCPNDFYSILKVPRGCWYPYARVHDQVSS